MDGWVGGWVRGREAKEVEISTCGFLGLNDAVRISNALCTGSTLNAKYA